MPAVKPQVELQPYRVAFIEDHPEFIRSRRLKYLKNMNVLTEGVVESFDRIRYADRWQPYYRRTSM